MKINIKQCLNFFDDPSVGGHATAVVGMIGEELNESAFKHYVKNRGSLVKTLVDQRGRPLPVTQGTQRGKRLDRWIEVKEKDKIILYQCEIKNWSATAIGGRYLGVEADETEIKNIANYYWSHQMHEEFSDTKYPNGVTKVFLKMRHPEGYSNIQPLLIYWMPISNSDNLEPFFEVPISLFNNPVIEKETKFEKLYIFSVSLYFRQLLKSDEKNKELIDFDMPVSKYRIEVLRSLGVL